MSDWLTGLANLTGRGEPAVLVTVVEARGSTPREPGARMTVGASAVHDTIGGGQLEHAAIESARLLLEQGDGGYINSVERHALSPRMGQCCGGVTRLLLERIPGERQPWADALMEARRRREISFIATPLGGSGKQVIAGPDGIRAGAVEGAARDMANRCMDTGRPVFDARAGWYIEPVHPPDFDVVLFGAGHVGRAVAGILATLPCTLTWVDSRADQFPAAPGPNVRMQNPRRPESIVADCPPGAFYLLMTHSHQLDFDICERILARGDFAYCGMIGSQSKRRSCEKRLKLKGITESMLDRLTCPIGVPGISGKRPAEIAVAAVAEILQIREKAGTKREADASTAG
jgi:xanthine dehydrogenase accessory factor